MSSQNNELIQNIASFAQAKLRPLVEKIDREKFYPADFLKELGEVGGFASLGNPNGGLLSQILVIRQIGRICGSTAFMVWCQSAFAWYLRQSKNQALNDKYLPDVLSGKQLAGTGMSNTMKHLSGIEKNNLKAIRVAGGYIVNGGLPWVSNLDETHIFGATAQINDSYVMFVLRCNANGVSIRRCPEFCALEGRARSRLQQKMCLLLMKMFWLNLLNLLIISNEFGLDFCFYKSVSVQALLTLVLM